MSDLCVQDHGDEQPRALPSLRLCPGCRSKLRSDLEALPGLYADLETALARGSSPRYGSRVSGSSAEPLPINAAAADHRDQIRHDLVWWVKFVAEERGLAGLPDDRVSEIAAWLGTHVDWIAAHPVAAVECPPVMRGLAARARGLLDPKRRLQTGERCRMTPDGAERCPGVISMVQGSDETWDARCSVCGPQEAAPYMRDRLTGRWVTRERVVAYALRRHGVRIRLDTVRQWAARGHITATSEHGAVWYELGTVEAYLARRHMMAG